MAVSQAALMCRWRIGVKWRSVDVDKQVTRLHALRVMKKKNKKLAPWKLVRQTLIAGVVVKKNTR